MNNPDSGRSTHRSSDSFTDKLAGAADEARARTAELADEAARQARIAASAAASAASAQMKAMLDRQVGAAASTVGEVARAVQGAADDLDRSAPLAASVMRDLSDRMVDYADGLQVRSADELLRNASDFSRRRPALVFGLAAMAGFVALRALKSRSGDEHPPRDTETGARHPSQQHDPAADATAARIGTVERPAPQAEGSPHGL